MNLDWLARKHGTDKSSSSHGYTKFYEEMFGSIRKRIHSVLELGVGDGASLRLWADWFPNATIYGLDQANPPTTLPSPIETFPIEQTNEEQLKHIFHDKYLQIVIDDCSHDQEKTLDSLKYLFPLLESEGWYVIEDMDPNSFPRKFSQWMEWHSAQYQSIQVFLDKGGGSHIYFIHKK